MTFLSHTSRERRLTSLKGCTEQVSVSIIRARRARADVGHRSAPESHEVCPRPPLGGLFFFEPNRCANQSPMLSRLLNWISPERRRFMRRFGRPARARIRERLEALGSPRAVGVISTLLDANLEFLAFALSSQGPLSNYSAGLNDERVEMCLAAMILFAIHLFAREELANNESELIPLLAAIAKSTTILVMVRRDSLRKTPRSEEWMLYTWMVAAL